MHKLGLEEKENQGVETLSGALDRTTSTEIINLLQGISKDRLVIVITHDPKICEFADEIVHIRNKTIVTELSAEHPPTIGKPLAIIIAAKASAICRAKKNVKAHIKQYIAAWVRQWTACGTRQS